LELEIRDQGVGIPENELNAIFNKFQQSSLTENGSGGTGLGLAICKEIIEGHHGLLGVRNNPEGGACFYFKVPLDQHITAE
jgi:signal transduction histidine kinase